MKERIMMFIIFICVFILLVDIYSFKGIKLLVSGFDFNVFKYFLYIAYWIVPIVIISSLFYIRSLQPFAREAQIFKNIYLVAGIFLLFYVPK
nr:hypothetical protein [Bacteroidales bacterium]